MYTFQSFLQHLECDPERGAWLASLSVQTKVEKFILAEIIYGARHRSGISLRLEDNICKGVTRCDLTIRDSKNYSHLLEWVEAKMCYSDCVSREVWSGRNPDEYARSVAADTQKQETSSIKAKFPNAVLTTALFVIHRTEARPYQKYQRDFRNRGSLSATEIRDAASDFCLNNIAQRSARHVSESFSLRLDDVTSLISYFYRSIPSCCAETSSTAEITDLQAV